MANFGRHVGAFGSRIKAASIEWYGTKVLSRVRVTMRHRVRIAGAHLKSRVQANISIPVGVAYNSQGNEVVVERSKPGEFPRRETGLLKGSISVSMSSRGDRIEAQIHSSAPYAARLESPVILNRVFMARTLAEEAATVRKILSGPIR